MSKITNIEEFWKLRRETAQSIQSAGFLNPRSDQNLTMTNLTALHYS